MLSINNLHDEILERQNKRNRIYEEVLEKIIAKIKYINSKSNDCYLVYTLPNFIYGIPLFNVFECGNYLYKRLTDAGFICKYNQKHNLFISWKTRPNKEKTLIPFQNTQPKSTAITYPNDTNNFLTLKNEPNMLKMKKIKPSNSQNKQLAFSEVDKMFLNIDHNTNNPQLTYQNIQQTPHLSQQQSPHLSQQQKQYSQQHMQNNNPRLSHTDNFYFYQGQNNNQYIKPGNYNNSLSTSSSKISSNNVKSISFSNNFNNTQQTSQQQQQQQQQQQMEKRSIHKNIYDEEYIDRDNLDDYLGTLI